jgi:hypothetical protein
LSSYPWERRIVIVVLIIGYFKQPLEVHMHCRRQRSKERVFTGAWTVFMARSEQLESRPRKLSMGSATHPQEIVLRLHGSFWNKG